MNVSTVIAFLLGICAGLVVMLLIVIKQDPYQTAQMEMEQRRCVVNLSILPTEADSLRYVLVDGHSECVHWVVRTPKK